MWCYGLSEEFSDGMEARMGITKAFFERVEHADGLHIRFGVLQIMRMHGIHVSALGYSLMFR